MSKINNSIQQNNNNSIQPAYWLCEVLQTPPKHAADIQVLVLCTLQLVLAMKIGSIERVDHVHSHPNAFSQICSGNSWKRSVAFAKATGSEPGCVNAGLGGGQLTYLCKGRRCGRGCVLFMARPPLTRLK